MPITRPWDFTRDNLPVWPQKIVGGLLPSIHPSSQPSSQPCMHRQALGKKHKALQRRRVWYCFHWYQRRTLNTFRAVALKCSPRSPKGPWTGCRQWVNPGKWMQNCLWACMCPISGAKAHGLHCILKDTSDSQESVNHQSRKMELKTPY